MLAKIGFDTAENEISKSWQIFEKIDEEEVAQRVLSAVADLYHRNRLPSKREVLPWHFEPPLWARQLFAWVARAWLQDAKMSLTSG